MGNQLQSSRVGLQIDIASQSGISAAWISDLPSGGFDLSAIHHHHTPECSLFLLPSPCTSRTPALSNTAKIGAPTVN